MSRPSIHIFELLVLELYALAKKTAKTLRHCVPNTIGKAIIISFMDGLLWTGIVAMTKHF